MHTTLRFGIFCACVGAATGSAAGLVAAPPAPAPPAATSSPASQGRSAAGAPSTDAFTAASASAAAMPPAAASEDPAGGSPVCAPPPLVVCTDPPPDPTPSPEAFRAFARARATVDRAVARGTWPAGDREALRKDLALLPLEARNDIEKPLVAAVREGRVRPAARGPLF